MTGDNAITYENCNNKKESHIRWTEIEKYPKILRINLTRYKFNIESLTKKKLTHLVEYQQVLNLNTIKYKLISVAMHSGSTTTSGHYTA